MKFREATDEKNRHHRTCNVCRGVGHHTGTQSTPTPSGSGLASPRGGLPALIRRPDAAGQYRPGPSERQRRGRQQDPTLDPNSSTRATDSALSDEDHRLLRNFHARLDKDVLETCTRCNEGRFYMGLNNDNVCNGCVKVDKDMNLGRPTLGEPYMFTDTNLMGPGPWYTCQSPARLRIC